MWKPQRLLLDGTQTKCSVSALPFHHFYARLTMIIHPSLWYTAILFSSMDPLYIFFHHAHKLCSFCAICTVVIDSANVSSPVLSLYMTFVQHFLCRNLSCKMLAYGTYLIRCTCMFQLLGNSIPPGQTFKNAVCQTNAEGDTLKPTCKANNPETVLFLCPKDEAITNLFGRVLFTALSNIVVIKRASQSMRKKGYSCLDISANLYLLLDKPILLNPL